MNIRNRMKIIKEDPLMHKLGTVLLKIKIVGAKIYFGFYSTYYSGEG